MPIRFEYDVTKDVENRRKHGFSLEAGALVIERALQVELDDGSENRGGGHTVG